MIGVGIDSGLVAHWHLHWVALGTSEPVRARYMCVIGTTSNGCHT